jgi:hypothetical protein
MPRVKVRAASLEIFSFRTNTGHKSSAQSIVEKSVNTAIQYTTNKILSLYDKTKPPVELTYEEKVTLGNAGILSEFEVVTDTGVVISQSTETTSVDKVVEVVTVLVDDAIVPLDALRYMNMYFQEPYITKGPTYMGPIQGYSALWKLFTDKIAETNNPDVRLLVYRDALDTMYKGRNMYIDFRRQENELVHLRERYDAIVIRLNMLLEKMAHESLAQFKQYCGSLGIRIRQPKPMIYAQALMNLEMAWYLYLYGSPVDPRIYPAIIEYVKAIGTREEAYDKLIALLDEKFRDDELQLQQQLQDIANSHQQSCSEPTSGSSEDCTSNDFLTHSEDDSSGYVSLDDDFHFKIYDKPNIFGDFTITPIYAHMGGFNGKMLVVGGGVTIDVNDRYDAKESAVFREHKRRRKKIQNLMYIVNPTATKQNALMMFVNGNLYVDVKDKYEKRYKNARIEEAKTAERRRKNGTYIEKQDKRRKILMYMIDPDTMITGNSNGPQKMLVLDGKLKLDILDKYDPATMPKNKFVEAMLKDVADAIKQAKASTSAKRRRKKHNKHNKHNKHCAHKKTKKKAQYILDPRTQTSGILIVKGSVGMTLGDMFAGAGSCIRITPGHRAAPIAKYIEDDNSPFEGRILIMHGGISIAVDDRFTRSSRPHRINCV